ncbi:beta-mannosidase [Mangrovihabitans endophyticus]|uniref:beta-mannosidase n=1 Tax=Mangrovihabitans endophyticus TaxID=1751298 RepID=A0A8J3C1W4_9ACTN|nr:glycoside hydrolase family 2 TIM barrel-domain containing protein [Mangrovihabitans endophyticus]GGK98754.1 beta-mannosidase [Mangrovihabitans endophyticus]
MTAYRPLHEGWTLAGADLSDIPATVPGCVHTDLLAAGAIADPYLDENELETAWIGRTTWVYTTSFDFAAETSRTDLVCAGLDTVATVTLNGVELGRTANMHRGYRFDARDALVDGRNTLQVTFDSAYGYAQGWRDRLGDRPNAYPEPFNFIRKTACNFGWDWGPTLVTAGIWQPIGLHGWTGGRLAEVRPQVTVHDGTGRVEVRVRLERETAEPLTVSASVGGRRSRATLADGEALLILTVDEPQLWWPRGYGEQHLHDLDVRLHAADGTLLDEWSRRIGFRSVRLDTTPDADGTPFTVIVNETPIFVRGVNWIPDDVFADRVTRDRLAERFQQAADANVNYLRVWGGGRYESEDFYDLADELGFLVGQDFLFACAAYPEEEPFASEVAAEAHENVVRLSSHPSLVMWTGNNENIWGHEDWDWKPALGDRTWGAGYYFDMLPAIVASLDPTRPYWPGSPWSGDAGRHPNDPAHGTMHIWDVWNTDDYTKYRSYRPRFVAEFGFQAPPAYATLRRALSDDPLAPDSPGMAHHQKAIGGDAKLTRGLDNHLPAPRDFDDWHYLTQLNQARAVAYGIEHFRSLRPLCMGTIMWQLNDCWPVTSWAAVDGDGRRKPLWYALRRAYADRLLTLQPRDGVPAAVLVNDSGTPWSATVTVTRRTLLGNILAAVTVGATVPPGDAVTLALPTDVTQPGDPAAELVLAEAGDTRSWWFFAADKDVSWPSAKFDASAAERGDVTRVTVTAHSILRDLTLYPDRVHPDATASEVSVTLLPGESFTFDVTGATGLDPVALTARPVLRCVNDVG